MYCCFWNLIFSKNYLVLYVFIFIQKKKKKFFHAKIKKFTESKRFNSQIRALDEFVYLSQPFFGFLDKWHIPYMESSKKKN